LKIHARTATEVDAFVGAQLRALRKSAGWSQTELADRVGVKFQQIQKYEKGMNRIGASRLWSFCQILDVKPNHFYEGLEVHLSKTNEKPRAPMVSPFTDLQPKLKTPARVEFSN